MLGNPSTCPGFRLKILCVIFSLACPLGGCQTTPPKDTVSKEQQLIDSQKAMVRNALDTGKPEQAMEGLRSLLLQFPEDASLQNLMGLTQLSLKNSARAITHFQIAYKLDHQVGTGLNLSSAYLDTGDFDKAERLLTALMKQADRDKYRYKERILHNMGLNFVQQKRAALAEKWFQKALEENPTFFPSHLELARLYAKTKRPAMAIKAYRKSMDHCLVCFEPVQALTSLYMRTGKYVDARRMLIQYGRIEGITDDDRARATRLLKSVASAPTNNRRG